MGRCWELDKNLPRKSIVLLFYLHFNNNNEIEILQHAHFQVKQASQCMNQFSNPCLAYSRCFGFQIFFLGCFVLFVTVGVIIFILHKRKSKTFTQQIFKLHFVNFNGKIRCVEAFRLLLFEAVWRHFSANWKEKVTADNDIQPHYTLARRAHQ